MGLRVVLGILVQQFVLWTWAFSFEERWAAIAGRPLPEMLSQATLISLVISGAYVITFHQLIERLQIKDWRRGARIGTYVGVIFGFGTLSLHYSRLGLSPELLWLDGGLQVLIGFTTGIVLTLKRSPHS